MFHDVKWAGLALVSVPSHRAETPLTYRAGPILGNNSHIRQLLTRLLCEAMESGPVARYKREQTEPLGEVAEQRCKQRRPATRFMHRESCSPTTSSLWGLTCIFWLAIWSQVELVPAFASEHTSRLLRLPRPLPGAVVSATVFVLALIARLFNVHF